MNKKSSIFILSIVFFISLFILFASSIVDARAGGGHRFSGGSSGYSSSRSYSSYGSSRSYSGGSSGITIDLSEPETYFFLFCHLLFSILLTILCTNKEDDFSHKVGVFVCTFVSFAPLFMCSCCLLPLVILFFFTPKVPKKNNNADYSFTEVSDYSSITSKDPDFTKGAFLERAKKAFVIVQEGWSNRDLSKAEAFLADGTYEQFQIQINTMKADHEIDVMKDINIKKAVIVRLSSKAGYDSLSVQFTVKAANYRVDDRNNNLKNGTIVPEEFTEIWTFMRRTGSKTIKNGLIEGYCPNCGAQVKGARLSKCPSCSALLRSGQHDWILAGITQASEWRNGNAENPIGYNSMISFDNSLNIQHLEDKLTVLFWRMVEANRLGSVEPIQKVSTDEFAQTYSNSNYSVAFPKCKECGLGSQEVIGFITNRPDYDYLLGQLVWSGFSIDKNEKVLNKTMFVLRRKKGVKSDPGKCFCSSHCPNCGAPEPNNLSLNTCEYCNSALNDDSKDWMLSDVVRDFNNTKAQEYMNDARKSTKIQDTKGESSEQQSDNINTAQGAFDVFDYYSGKDLISITVAMMLADGFIDNRELNIIYGISKARSVSEKELMQIIERLRKVSDPVKFVLETTAIKLDENLIRLLISIAAADGNIDDTEVEMLHKIAERMGLSQNKLRDMINEAYENNWNKS